MAVTDHTDHWLSAPHWSSDIPLDTPHPRVSALDEHGYVVLRDVDPIPESEYIDRHVVSVGEPEHVDGHVVPVDQRAGNGRQGQAGNGAREVHGRRPGASRSAGQ